MLGGKGAVESADILTKKASDQNPWGYRGRLSRNYSEQEEHKIKPHMLRNLPKYTAVVVHCERGHQRTVGEMG